MSQHSQTVPNCFAREPTKVVAWLERYMSRTQSRPDTKRS